MRSIDSIPHSTQWRRGDEQTHLEEEHSSEEELLLDHSHSAFTKNVDPEIFSDYLNGIFNEYQKLSSFNKNKMTLLPESIDRLIIQFSNDFHTYRLNKTSLTDMAISSSGKENIDNVAETKKNASRLLSFQFWRSSVSLRDRFKITPSKNKSTYIEKSERVNSRNAW